jgi:5-methylcytosine-specific restriction endonuclease McrA
MTLHQLGRCALARIDYQCNAQGGRTGNAIVSGSPSMIQLTNQGGKPLPPIDRHKTGHCAICGVEGPLTFEHVPPKSAFNDRAVLLETLAEMLRREVPRETKGVGAYSLCERCNNRTGSIYGTTFVDWCRDGLHFRDALGRDPAGLTATFSPVTYPLRVAKQILVMFATVNGPGWFEKRRDLRRLVQSKDERGLPADCHCYLYLASGPRSFRWSGFSGHGHLDRREFSVYSELCYPPFGYVMCADSAPPHKSMCNIDHFFCFPFRERREVDAKLPVLPVESYLPGDYRTVEEMDEHLRSQGIDPATYRGWERY